VFRASGIKPTHETVRVVAYRKQRRKRHSPGSKPNGRDNKDWLDPKDESRISAEIIQQFHPTRREERGNEQA
jgi:hypothetical protein